jgi:putative PIN family toxin of toxin-antitoxin system
VIRAVIDPGVLVSAFIGRRGSAPDRIMRAWGEGAFEVLASPHLLSELAGVLGRPKFAEQAAGGRADAYVAAVAGGAMLIEDSAGPEPVTADPGDDYLFALARSGQADVIVSGDRHLAEIARPAPPALTPRTFVNRLPKESG